MTPSTKAVVRYLQDCLGDLQVIVDDLRDDEAAQTGYLEDAMSSIEKAIEFIRKSEL